MVFYLIKQYEYFRLLRFKHKNAKFKLLYLKDNNSKLLCSKWDKIKKKMRKKK